VSPSAKFENQLIFGEVMGKSLVSCFFLTVGVDALVAIASSMWAVKLCSNKMLQFLSGGAC